MTESTLTRSKVREWIARLNWLAAHPHERAERRAECALLGHVPSGERFLTAIPTHICWFCADEFQEP